MEFKTDRPIYRQIVDYAFARILCGSWKPGDRVPSVRELAVALAVNSHTVLKAYDELQADGIISPRRGMGFYLNDDAPALVAAAQRKEFFETVLTDVFTQMDMLGISITELTAFYAQLKSSNPL